MKRTTDFLASNPVSRRAVLQAGSLGLLGLSSVDVAAWRARAAEAGVSATRHRAVIYIFLTGGLSQHDSFDMKPEGPTDFKGEFNPIATRTPGIQICEHMPLLAQRSDRWALVRSLTHNNNGHDAATYMMLTGKSAVPPTYRSMKPQSIDAPSIAAIAGATSVRRNHLPPVSCCRRRFITRTPGCFPVNSRDCWDTNTSRGSSRRPTSRTPIIRTPARFPSTSSICTRGTGGQIGLGASRYRISRCRKECSRSLPRAARNLGHRRKAAAASRRDRVRR